MTSDIPTKTSPSGRVRGRTGHWSKAEGHQFEISKKANENEKIKPD
jgi:hypothetical protein